MSGLKKKIKLAKAYIKEFYEKNDGKVYVSFSGGKDSTVLLHLAREMYPDIKAVFSNTTNELPDVITFVKKTPNVDWVYPSFRGKPVNFIWGLKYYGFPLISKEVSQKVNELKHTKSEYLKNKRLNGDKNGNGKLSNKHKWLADELFDVSAKCCDLLKKRPLLKYQEVAGLKPLIALMSDESNLRKQLSLNGKEDIKKGYPFLKTGWCEGDIWGFAKKFKLRFAECYYGVSARKRTGCAFCAFGIRYDPTRISRLGDEQPKLHDKILNIENNGVRFEDALQKVGVKTRCENE